MPSHSAEWILCGVMKHIAHTRARHHLSALALACLWAWDLHQVED
jgi:hypothetical protein